MFTGIVEEVGRLRARHGSRLGFDAAAVLCDAAVGSSIAVNGCCLTVVELGDGWWSADLSDETLARTNLGSLQPGDPVNLERPVALGGRLGGHLVQGHVDRVGLVLSPPPDLEVETPPTPYVVEKGSITVDGVSLTVVDSRADSFTVAVIPHTAEATTLGARRVGDLVNIEFDLVAKYEERLVGGR